MLWSQFMCCWPIFLHTQIPADQLTGNVRNAPSVGRGLFLPPDWLMPPDWGSDWSEEEEQIVLHSPHQSTFKIVVVFVVYSSFFCLLLKQWKGKGMRVSDHLDIKFDDVEISPILTWSGLSMIIPIMGDNDDPWQSANTRSGFDLILFNTRIMGEFEAMRCI